jgi:regulator of telomere elongation helicase 1
LARAIVLVGVPYPPIFDKRIEMKKQYLDKVYNDKTIQTKKINGKDWYFNQAIKAVNQSIGRLIRHKDDYGAIFLCDIRFSGNDV